MTHYHGNQRIDGGTPVCVGTTRDFDSLSDSLRAIIPGLEMSGWELRLWNVKDCDTVRLLVAEFVTEHFGTHEHTLTMSVWACTCMQGEHELNRQIAHMN